MPQERLLQKLMRTVRWATKSSFYQKKMEDVGLKIGDIKTIDDFQKLPIMDANDLRAHGTEFSAVPREKIYGLFATGGTTGASKLIYWTEKALQESEKIQANYLGRFLDLRGKLAVSIIPSDNLATAGEHLKKTFIHLGAFVAQMGILYTDGQKNQLFSLLQREKPCLIVGNPVKLTGLLDSMKKKGIEPKKLGIKYVVSTSEVLVPKVKKVLQKSFGAMIIEVGGMTEVGASTLECAIGNGQHITEVVYAEVINPLTGKGVMNGIGEFFLTTLINPAYPLVRYKTEDIVKISSEKCKCGLDSPRIWYKNRLSEMFTIGTQTIFVYQIDDVLNRMGELTSNYRVVITSIHTVTSIVFNIECDKKHQTRRISKKAKELLINALGFNKKVAQKEISLEVQLVDIDTLERTPRGKIANRVQDLRLI